ncbi:MAG: GntR family transcriptional regulator [Acidimicrobiales bacterium]
MTPGPQEAARTADGSLRGAISLKRRPDSLTYSVYEAIKQAIVDGRLPSDTRVTEAALAKQLVVSKTPVREALLRLKEIGLIEADGPKVGRIVRPSFNRLRDAYEVREALEAISARAAAERGDRTLLLAARQKAEATVAAAEVGDLASYQRADDAFHHLVARAGANEQLTRLIDDANVLVSVLRQRATPEMGASLVCARRHVAIAEALLHGEGAEAFGLMAEHVREVRDAVLAPMLEANGPRAGT